MVMVRGCVILIPRGVYAVNVDQEREHIYAKLRLLMAPRSVSEVLWGSLNCVKIAGVPPPSSGRGFSLLDSTFSLFRYNSSQ